MRTQGVGGAQCPEGGDIRSGSMPLINRGSIVMGWMADIIELETYFILGQRQVSSDWWISENKHNLCHECALLDKREPKKPNPKDFRTKRRGKQLLKNSALLNGISSLRQLAPCLLQREAGGRGKPNSDAVSASLLTF